MVDLFTKFSAVVLITDHTAKTAAQIVWMHLCITYGWLQKIHQIRVYDLKASSSKIAAIHHALRSLILPHAFYKTIGYL